MHFSNIFSTETTALIKNIWTRNILFYKRKSNQTYEEVEKRNTLLIRERGDWVTLQLLL